MNELLKSAIVAWDNNGCKEAFEAVVKASYEGANCQPKFVHDCDRCLFLGHDHDMDLYICVNKLGWVKPENANMSSMILRQGNHGSDYFSYFAPEAFSYAEDFIEKMKGHQPAYITLLGLAKELGLYKGKF